MRALVEIQDRDTWEETEAQFDNWVMGAGDYYETPAGMGAVVPEFFLGDAEDDNLRLRHSLGLSHQSGWDI